MGNNIELVHFLCTPHVKQRKLEGGSIAMVESGTLSKRSQHPPCRPIPFGLGLHEAARDLLADNGQVPGSPPNAQVRSLGGVTLQCSRSVAEMINNRDSSRLIRGQCKYLWILSLCLLGDLSG